MLSQCSKCGLSKSTGPMGSVLPQCQCDWKLPTAQPQQETEEWHEIVLNQKQFLDKMESLLAKTAASPQRTWVGLTDEDRQAAFESMPNMLDGFLKTWGWLHFSKAIEAKLKQKNGYAEEQNT